MSQEAAAKSAVQAGKGRPAAESARARDGGQHSHDREQCQSCHDHGGLIQRCAGNGDPGCACGVDDVLHAPGRPLEPAVRADMEDRFDADFSRVRVHTDAAAAASARRLNAHAYTIGRNVAFAPGRYAPETGAGRQMLAHELAHVLQQNTAVAAPRRLAVSAPGDAGERAADAMADAALAGRPVRPPVGHGAPWIARQGDDTCYLGHYDGQGELVPRGEGGGDGIYYRVWGTWRGGEDLARFGQRIFRAWVPWRFGPLPEDVRRKVMEHIYATVLQKHGHGVGHAGCDYWIAMDKATLARLRELSGEVERERRLADAKAAEGEKAAGRGGDAGLSKATVDERLAMLEGRIGQRWTGGKDEEAILQILDSAPPEQAAELSRRLATDRIGDETFLDALDRVVDLGNNMELHTKLTTLHLRALGPEAGLAAAEKAPILPWHDVMGLAELSATFSATRGAGGKITIKYHRSSSLLNPDAPFADELNALPFDVKVGGKSYDPEELFKVHDWDEGRFVTLRARDLVAFTHVGVRKFVQDVATVASLVTPVGAARTAVGKAAVITMERILPITVLLIDENRLNLVKWFPTWGPRMVQFSDVAKMAMGAYGLAQFARSGVGFFRAWKAARNARRVWEATAASADAERVATQIEKQADEIFAAAERFQQAETAGQGVAKAEGAGQGVAKAEGAGQGVAKAEGAGQGVANAQGAGQGAVRVEDLPDVRLTGPTANDTTSWQEALAARRAEQARQAEQAAAPQVVQELEDAENALAGTGTDGGGPVRPRASGGGTGSPPPPGPPKAPQAAPWTRPPAPAVPPPSTPVQKVPTGVRRGSGPALERPALAQYRELRPVGAETAERFALHEPIGKGDPANRFNRIAQDLEQRFALLRKAGKPAPKLNLDVLKEDSAAFVLRNKSLKGDFEKFYWRYERLKARGNLTEGDKRFLREFDEFFVNRTAKPPAGTGAGGAAVNPAEQKGAIGLRRPDIVEFALDQGQAVVTDVTGQGKSSWHQFKTRFYQQVLKEMLPDLAVEAYELEETASIFLGVVK